MTPKQFRDGVNAEIRAIVAQHEREYHAATERPSVVPIYPDLEPKRPDPDNALNCPICGGTGLIDPVTWSIGRPWLDVQRPCWKCWGKGRV